MERCEVCNKAVPGHILTDGLCDDCLEAKKNRQKAKFKQSGY